MRRLSRHLPSLDPEGKRVPLLAIAILAAILVAVGCWIYSSPFKATVALGGMFAFVVSLTILDRRMIARLREEREDTICEFRRSFDVRKVDPWIIRATHEAFGALLAPQDPHFPLRASDSIEDDLKMDWEDIDDLAREVAQRAGYDISDCETNPLSGNIKTVEDFVMFFTHQPKTKQEEAVVTFDGEGRVSMK